jgi:hypothetical protein
MERSNIRPTLHIFYGKYLNRQVITPKTQNLVRAERTINAISLLHKDLRNVYYFIRYLLIRIQFKEL